MRDQGAARMPTPVLAGLLIVGLAVGAAWWTASSPPAGAGSLTATGAAALAASGEAAGAGSIPPLPRVAMVEPPASPRQYRLRAGADSAAHSFAVRGDTPTDPADLVLALEPETLDWLLPPAEAPAVRGGVLLGRGASRLVEGPGAIGAYRLEIACTGGVALQVEVFTDHTLPHRTGIACGGEPASIDIHLSAGYAGVRFTHPDEVYDHTDAGAGSLLLAVAYQLQRR